MPTLLIQVDCLAVAASHLLGTVRGSSGGHRTDARAGVVVSGGSTLERYVIGTFHEISRSAPPGKFHNEFRETCV